MRNVGEEKREKRGEEEEGGFKQREPARANPRNFEISGAKRRIGGDSLNSDGFIIFILFYLSEKRRKKKAL